jgi:hypothetical protein
MGITRLKKLIADELTRNFNTDQLKKFSTSIQQNIDFHKLTGYPPHISIPTREAAKQIVNYFYKNNQFLNLLNLLFKYTKIAFFGKKISLKNSKAIFFEFNECGFKFDQNLNQIIKFDRNNIRNDWGFLNEGNIYSFCFVSVDICGNSRLVRTYDNINVKKTYQNFNQLVKTIANEFNGRIWSWEGDGGLITFHINEFINDAILTAIKIISNMPYFNCVLSMIEEDIKIRIGINAGEAEYKTDIQKIHSEAMNLVREIEKSYTEPMTISITKHTLQYADLLIRSYFKELIINEKKIYQLQFPLLGVDFEY